MIKWIVYIAFVLWVTSCKSVKKTIELKEIKEKEASVLLVQEIFENEDKEVFIEEVEEKVTETFASVQTDSGTIAVPVKTTLIKRRIEKTKIDSFSDSETRVQEVSFLESESVVGVSKELEETEIPGKVTESVFAGNLWRILSILLTVAGAVGTWYLKKNGASSDSDPGN